MSTTAIVRFRAAIAAAGIPAPDVIEDDGHLQRFSTNGKPTNKDGWYLLHTDGIPAGTFGCWRAGLQSNWCAKSGTAMTEAERHAHRQRIKAMQAQRDADLVRRQHDAAQSASELWAKASPASAGYQYLARKGIQPHGAREFGDRLLIPMRDTSGTLHSLQTIATNGDKRFHAGGRIRGCYFGIGKPNDTLIVCEGFATGASIHECTGHAVAVAFNAGNVLEVAQSLRSKYPELALVVAADDDWRTEGGNPGLAKATEAAQAVGGRLAMPVFGTDRPDKATDFNDLHQLAGAEAVRRCFDDAIKSIVTNDCVADAVGMA